MNINQKIRAIFLITLSITCFLYTAFMFNESMLGGSNFILSKPSTGTSIHYNIFMVETNEKSEYMSLKVK